MILIFPMSNVLVRRALVRRKRTLLGCLDHEEWWTPPSEILILLGCAVEFEMGRLGRTLQNLLLFGLAPQKESVDQKLEYPT